MKNKIIITLRKSLTQIIFVIFGASIVFGLYFLIVNSIRPSSEIMQSKFSIPSSITLDNIIGSWVDAGISIGFKNSLIFGVSTVIVVLVLGIIAAYPIAFLRFRFKRLVYLTMISTMYISPMILILPLVMQYSNLGLMNSYIGVIIIYVGMKLGFAVFLLTTYFKGLPLELIEAASIDGSNRFGIMKHVILPLSTPAILTLALLVFNGVWCDLLIGVVFLQKAELRPIMVAISVFRGTEITNTSFMFAGSLIATLPIMVLYGIVQKYFIKGMTLGALK